MARRANIRRQAAASATRPKRRQGGLLYPRASSPLTENFPAKLALLVARSLAVGSRSPACRVLPHVTKRAGGLCQPKNFAGYGRNRLAVSNLSVKIGPNRLALCGDSTKKMELADIEIAAWRGDISSASSVVPLIVQTKKGRCPWYDRTPLIRTLVV